MLLKLSDKTEIIKEPYDILVLNDENTIFAKDSKGHRIKTELNDIYKIKHSDMYQRFGFIQGDGCLGRLKSKNHKGLELNIGYKDDDILSLFNLCKIENCRSYYVNGYNQKLVKEGFDHRNLPEREFPINYKNWNKLSKLSFLNGCYSANGSVIKRYRVAYKTTCFNFANQLKNFLLEFNISANITTNKSKKVKFSNGEYLCKESYDININKFSDIVKFYYSIGFIQEYKMRDLVDLINIKSPMVMKIIQNQSNSICLENSHAN